MCPPIMIFFICDEMLWALKGWKMLYCPTVGGVELSKEDQSLVDRLIALGYNEGVAYRFIMFFEDYAGRCITFGMPKRQLIEEFLFKKYHLNQFRMYWKMA